MPTLIEIITSTDPYVRNFSLDEVCKSASYDTLLSFCAELDLFRRNNHNLYERVRALFFLYAIHRYHIPLALDQHFQTNNPTSSTHIPYQGYEFLLQRRFEEAINLFFAACDHGKNSPAIHSALANAYYQLAFQTLANQVRHSVRTVRGNQWMFRVGHPSEHPLRIRPELIEHGTTATHAILHECTPVRMDLSHSGWSDIFFLGMDYPEGARVINVSIDLGVHGRDPHPRPPVEAFLRVIPEPIIRLTSIDLGATADICELSEIFDFARDYLGLLKAALIASGIVPPGLEGSNSNLSDLLARLIAPGMGLELVSQVNDIPKGSRLAVSTNLLASLISLCMRATGQTQQLTDTLAEDERRVVAARAILGEWLAGSGGGWQDSGGVWPGAKLIEGTLARDGDLEYGISRGRLLPQHKLLNNESQISALQTLQHCLVLVHGGMAQNVGPILEMVTEKYLLRSEPEWVARQQAGQIFDEILGILELPDSTKVPKCIGNATTRNFFGPIQTIIPWASNAFTERIIHLAHAHFGDDFWGFWMLGGMSGGGMGFIVAPHRHAEAQRELLAMMRKTKLEMQDALPFAMEPVVYDFAINTHGSAANLLKNDLALMPKGYYAYHVPQLIKRDIARLTPTRRAELTQFAHATRTNPSFANITQTIFERLIPRVGEQNENVVDANTNLQTLLAENGFDRIQHEQIREDLRSGRIGLAQNRLPVNTLIEDVLPSDVFDATDSSRIAENLRGCGENALKNGEVAVVSLAAGAGSRWTQGAGVVKALHPFCKMGGAYRSFLEVHLAKTQHVERSYNTTIPHVFTTSYVSHKPIQNALQQKSLSEKQSSAVYLSPGRSVGLRLIPTARDLHFAYEELSQQMLDEQKQKVRESGHQALIQWARSAGEASDYTDNLPSMCLHPVGHWFEIPNMLLNGVLNNMLQKHPQLNYLMLHNIDTVGANIDAGLLGWHINQNHDLSFEVVARLLTDRGGGLARENGQLRIIESLALPHEADEFKLSYYNSMTTWISIDGLLRAFELERGDLTNLPRVSEAVRHIAQRMPTYITLKDVKKRWGHGQEDVFPVTQWEKLWSDMSALPMLKCGYLAVSRYRGQQLKDQAQLDGWLRDGSAAYVTQLCGW